MVKEIWVHILESLRKDLLYYKPYTFWDNGPYHSLSMISNHQVITEKEMDKLCSVAPTAEIVLKTINEHFYFFGKTDDPTIIPLNTRWCQRDRVNL